MSNLGKHSPRYLHGIMKVNTQGERTDAFTQGDINHYCVFSMENSLSREIWQLSRLLIGCGK